LRKSQIYIQFFIVLTFFLSSCNTIKYLEKKGEIEKDEYLLSKISTTGNKNISKDKFSPLYQQKPNKKMPLIGSKPYFYFYIIGKLAQSEDKTEQKRAKVNLKYAKRIASDSTNSKRTERLITQRDEKIDKLNLRAKEGNSFMRTFGEKPAIADIEKLERAGTMMNQMMKAKGYYQNKVFLEYDTNGKKLAVTYRIQEGIPHKIGSIQYVIKNPKVSNLISATTKDSPLAVDNRLDESYLVQERDRIDKLLKDNGYYDFNKQYISFSIDTNATPYRADVKLSINADSNSTIFKRYKIGEIICLLEYNKFGKTKPDTVMYDKVQFAQTKNKYGKKVIAGKIKFRPTEYYSLAKTINTQLNLSNLDNFKYIDIQHSKSTTSDSILNVIIVLNSNKKYQITDEWGLNVSQGLPGPQGSISFLDRNVLRGCENIDASIRYGIEGVASATDPNVIYRTAEAAADVGITFPQLYIPTRLRFKFNNYFPRTRFSFAFNNIIRPEYSRRNYKLAVNYTLIRNTFSRYIFSLADLNVIQTPRTTQGFSDYLTQLLNQGNTLVTSFQPSFVSSIHLTYLFNNNDFTRFVNARFLRLFAESGGTSMRLIENRLMETGVINNDNKLLGELAYYKFIKLNADYRIYRSVTPKSQIAFRLNSGVAITSGLNKTLPYEKYFFSGGSNSIRAWRPRRLGPGSQAPTNFLSDGSFDYKFEQPGELIIESSIESRFKIIKFIEGAIFADAGNVWRFGTGLNSEVLSQFNPSRFYKEIAVGTGFGLRFNFTFILVRFDLGMKVYDPALPQEERLVVNNWSVKNFISKKEYGLLNIGIGYPF